MLHFIVSETRIPPEARPVVENRSEATVRNPKVSEAVVGAHFRP